MAILVLKFVLNLFINEESNLSFFKYFTKITSPVLKVTLKVTPNFVVQPLIPLYLAWLFFMIRIYFLPLVLGYSYIGTFAFVFEKQIIEQIKYTKAILWSTPTTRTLEKSKSGTGKLFTKDNSGNISQ